MSHSTLSLFAAPPPPTHPTPHPPWLLSAGFNTTVGRFFGGAGFLNAHVAVSSLGVGSDGLRPHREAQQEALLDAVEAELFAANRQLSGAGPRVIGSGTAKHPDRHHAMEVDAVQLLVLCGDGPGAMLLRQLHSRVHRIIALELGGFLSTWLRPKLYDPLARLTKHAHKSAGDSRRISRCVLGE